MLEFLTTEAILVMLAFGFLIALTVAAGAIGARRRRDPNFTPEPVRFVPHWHLMSLLGVALLAILAAILIPLVMRLLGR